MTILRRHIISVLVLLAASCVATATFAQESGGANPMQPFARLVGGQWHMGDSYQVFEWGPGELALHGRSYRVGESGPVQVGEGMLFNHPGDQAIRGFFTAVGMGIDLFDYTVKRLDENRIVFELRTYGAMKGKFEEVWAFTDDNHFEWSLSQFTDEGLVEMMSGTFVRKPE